MNEKELVLEMSRKTHRSRTAILLVEARHFGKEPDIAAQAGMDHRDFTAYLASEISENARYVDITTAKLFDKLRYLAGSPEGGDCLLVYNFDLPLARLDTEDRLRLWKNIRDNMAHKQRALVLLMPADAAHLLPTEDELSTWDSSSRLAKAEY